MASAAGDDGDDACPLCLEQLDITDKHIEFCLGCSYRMCLWCWHRIMEDAMKDGAVGRCPNCRTEYDRERIVKGRVDPSELAKEMKRSTHAAGACKNNNKHNYKRNQHHQFSGSSRHSSGHGGRHGPTWVGGDVSSSELSSNGNHSHGNHSQSRRHLQSVRVIQRNLVYCIGIPLKYCREDVLRKDDFFGKYGRVLKVSVNRNPVFGSKKDNKDHHSNGHGHGSGAHRASTGSAYVTFKSAGDAVKCIQRVNGSSLDGNVIRACFGTTKYCNAFLKYQVCSNPDCLYLHEIGDHSDSFTKEQMMSGSANHVSADLSDTSNASQQSFHDLTQPNPHPHSKDGKHSHAHSHPPELGVKCTPSNRVVVAVDGNKVDGQKGDGRKVDRRKGDGHKVDRRKGDGNRESSHHQVDKVVETSSEQAQRIGKMFTGTSGFDFNEIFSNTREIDPIRHPLDPSPHPLPHPVDPHPAAAYMDGISFSLASHTNGLDGLERSHAHPSIPWGPKVLSVDQLESAIFSGTQQHPQPHPHPVDANEMAMAPPHPSQQDQHRTTSRFSFANGKTTTAPPGFST